MTLTRLEWFWYVVLYAYAGFGLVVVGYWLKKVVDSLKSKGERTT